MITKPIIMDQTTECAECGAIIYRSEKHDCRLYIRSAITPAAANHTTDALPYLTGGKIRGSIQPPFSAIAGEQIVYRSDSMRAEKRFKTELDELKQKKEL